MVIFVLLTIILAAFGVRLQKKEDNSFMERDNTLSIIGIFTILIMLSHICQTLQITYQTSNNFFDKSGSFVLGLFGEQVVAPFLFYSGFGIALSFSKKRDYLPKFIFNRIFKIIICFLFITFFSLLLRSIINVNFENFFNECSMLFKMLLEYWYIHAILICYSLSFVVQLVNKLLKVKSNIFLIIATFVAGISLYVFCYYFLPFYRLCILCYFFGSLFYYFLPFFKEKMDNNKYFRVITPIIVVLIYFSSRLGCYLLHYQGIAYLVLYQICNFGLCFSLVILTYFVQIKNKVLVYIGKNTIYIYLLLGLANIIIQRINISVILQYSILYTLLATVLVAILSFAFSFPFNYMWKYLLKLFNFVYSKLVNNQNETVQ